MTQKKDGGIYRDRASLPDPDTMYQAFESRDSQFEGVFYTGVRTTGIFCRPTCTARKPKRENLEFFATTKEALDYGYRPCKRCRPMEPPGAAPEWVSSIVEAAQGHGDARLKDRDLRERGLDPARVRRWFKRTHGMTFHAYARQLRLNRAYGTIRNHGAVTDQAFESGYESLSGFGDAFKRATGFPPSASARRSVGALTRLSTPIGPMVAVAVDGRLCLLEFADRPMLETQLSRVRQIFSAQVIAGTDAVFGVVQSQLDQYFDGARKDFELPIDLSGTVFQTAVWQELCRVPYGETRTYGEQARAVGTPKAVRAVGRANGDNRIAIIVPCHRVVGADGRLTGYGGGLWRKRYLLELEGAFA